MSARLLRRIVRVSRRLALRFVFSRLDRFRPTFAAGSPEGELSALIGGSVKPREREAARIGELARHYLDHRFDLLGSGWVNVRYGMACNGVEGHRYAPAKADSSPAARINKANLAEVERIGGLIDRDYVLIDWQLDFKSGYRWSEKTGFRQVSFGRLPGVDIKVPWELARMQHLPQLALAHSLASEYEKSPPGTACAREYRNQVLDFIANNPPRFGVNWACAMDVAIRVANWLVAYDLFKAGGAGFDREFEAIFSRSVYEHGCHIIRNLEWSDEFRGNHYLADIAGLLFVSAYLPRSRETDTWLAFSVQQLIGEVQAQFTPDGANFEASTSYHRLSAELVIFSTAVVLGLPEEKRKALTEYDCRLHKVKPALAPAPMTFHGSGENASPFPEWYFERVEKMAEFTMHITKPDGKIPQIGDNDSGYFLKFSPPLIRLAASDARSCYANLANYRGLPDDAPYLMEDHLDHRQLVGAINALFDRRDFSAFSGDSFASRFVFDLAGNKRRASYLATLEKSDAERFRMGTNESFEHFKPDFGCRSRIRIPVPGESIREGLNLYAYPDFGIFIFRSRRLYLALRCGPVGQNGNGGHAHNDQLAIELSIDGENRIVDPGTYLYTAHPKKRNEYRSVGAHFAPRVPGKEPARLDLDLFRLEETTRARCLYFGESGFIGMHEGYGKPVWRVVSIGENEVQILDYYSGATDVPEEIVLEGRLPGRPPVSPGYGIVYA
jgi:hypothetical protein